MLFRSAFFQSNFNVEHAMLKMLQYSNLQYTEIRNLVRCLQKYFPFHAQLLSGDSTPQRSRQDARTHGHLGSGTHFCSRQGAVLHACVYILEQGDPIKNFGRLHALFNTWHVSKVKDQYLPCQKKGHNNKRVQSQNCGKGQNG